MRVPIYQVDAFAGAVFAGNPAAVCPLERWLPDETMQRIAAENNLSETAFYVREGDGYRIRWFTPSVEVDLCGHATLAAAAVILDFRNGSAANRSLAAERHEPPRVEFASCSGPLGVTRLGDRYELDFPARPAIPCDPDPALIDALGVVPEACLRDTWDVAVFANEESVRALQPDMAAVARLERFAVIATAPGSDCDFVSRFFAPAKGIPEDPVTGSAHTTLIPYWSRRLGKTRMFARQVSARGGELWCEDRGSRVGIAGQAVLYLEGTIEVPSA